MSGEADVVGAPELKACIAEEVDRGARDLIFGMSQVTYVDSSALAVLIGARRRVSRAGGSIQVVEPPLQIRDVLEATGLAAVISIAADVEEAKARIAPG